MKNTTQNQTKNLTDLSSTEFSRFHYMSHAIELARRGLYTADPNPAVGCVLVKNDKIIGEGWHEKAGAAHAEVNALAMAGDRAQSSTAFVTLEPCSHFGRTPPCADALIRAGVKRIIIAMLDPNPLVAGKGVKKLQQAGIAVETGIMEEDARKLNSGFICRMEKRRPFIRIKSAMSLDGATALASGESKWITSDKARLDVHKLRAQASVILTGAGTVLADDPLMNARLPRITRQPVRMVLDAGLEISPDSRIIGPDTYVITGDEVSVRRIKAFSAKCKVKQLAATDGEIDLDALVAWLNEQNVNLLHVEAGAVLSGGFIRQGLFDELVIYMAPKIMGNKSRALYNVEIISMSELINVNISDIKILGKDIRITAEKSI